MPTDKSRKPTTKKTSSAPKLTDKRAKGGRKIREGTEKLFSDLESIRNLTCHGYH